MYNPLFSGAFVPGFNVKPPDEAPGFDVGPQDAVPGFNVEDDSVPRRETWSDGTAPESAMPPWLTAANCTTVNGTLGCRSPGGVSFGYPVRPSAGFPERLDSGVDHYHAYSVPDGPYRDPAETLRQHIINVPTPGPGRFVRPATVEGTLNEATPEWMYDYLVGQLGVPYGTLINPVRSYLVTDQSGNQIVVNVTEGNQILTPGYVVRYVTTSDDGSTIQNEGEGSGLLQGPYSPPPLRNWINNAWRGLYQQHLDRNKRQP